MQVTFGTPDSTWQEYNLMQYPLVFDNKASSYKAIIRDDKLVKILGKDYQLFPNEEAIKLASEAAKLASFSPFNIPENPAQNVIYNKDGTRMHAWFAPKNNEEYVIGNDKVNIGVDVSNSIDGSSSFGCGIFTFRELCSNGVILGKQKLFSLTKVHTKGLQPVIDQLKTIMIQIMEQTTGLLTSYRQLAQQQATKELIEKLKKSRLSKKVLPEYLTAEEPTVKVQNLNQWELYNDITELIWHNVKADLKTKTFQFDRLHKIMPLQVK